jgi:hypothetical protein
MAVTAMETATAMEMATVRAMTPTPTPSALFLKQFMLHHLLRGCIEKKISSYVI